jgi:hypothetical protein
MGSQQEVKSSCGNAFCLFLLIIVGKPPKANFSAIPQKVAPPFPFCGRGGVLRCSADVNVTASLIAAARAESSGRRNTAGNR